MGRRVVQGALGLEDVSEVWSGAWTGLGDEGNGRRELGGRWWRQRRWRRRRRRWRKRGTEVREVGFHVRVLIRLI